MIKYRCISASILFLNNEEKKKKCTDDLLTLQSHTVVADMVGPVEVGLNRSFVHIYSLHLTSRCIEFVNEGHEFSANCAGTGQGSWGCR